jgi:MFS family permease
MQVVGGTLADRYGGERVLEAGIIFWSVLTLLTPWAASMGVGPAVLVRIGLGLGEGEGRREGTISFIKVVTY